MRRVLGTVVGLLVVALVATTALAVVRGRQLDAAEQRVATLEARVVALESEAEAAQADASESEADTDPDGGDDPLGSLLDDAPGTLDDLLGGLTGDGAGLPALDCLTGTRGLDELLSGGGLEDLLGGGRSEEDAAPTDPDALVDHIADEVAQLRELPFTDEVDVEFGSGDEVAERVTELVLSEYDGRTADTEGRLLAALGVVAPGTDMQTLRTDLLGQQVAGFYLPETGELMVRVPDDGEIGTLDQITLAHELDHALIDQALDFPDDVLADTTDSDAARAALAVTEGDATLLMSDWALGNVGLSDQLALATDPSAAAASASLDEVPHYLAQELLFAYTTGMAFVCDVYNEGGWDAVDALYEDLPVSTAQVLDPQRYHEGQEPADPSELAAPEGFTERLTTTWGAANLRWLFEAPGNDPAAALDDPGARALAWAGGEATVWADGARSAVGFAFVDGGDGTPLCASITDWYTAAFPTAESTGDDDAVWRGDQQTAAIACDGDGVRLAVAPTADLATSIVDGG